MELAVVVGVDGSPQSQVAVDLGAHESRLHHRPLRLVHAFVWPLLGVYLGPSPEGPPGGGLSADADRLLAEALARATATAPELTITAEVVTGAVVPVLLEEASRAELMVLGDRGLGGFTGLLVGSVAVQVAAHGSCPLLIARGRPDVKGPVVVGVDGPPSGAAVDFAFAEAAARGAELVALRTWYGGVPSQVDDDLPLVYDPDDVNVVLAKELSGAIAAKRSRYPTVAVRAEVRYGRAARTLVDVSNRAQLVVVGARGRGGFAGLLLGSVSQAVLHHAGCPVAIVRGGERRGHGQPSAGTPDARR